MRRSVVIALAVFLCALSLGGFAVAQADGPNRPPWAPTPNVETLHYFGRLSAETVVPSIGGPPPAPDEWVPAVGDVGIRQDELFALTADTKGPVGDPLGTVDMQCTYTRVDFEAAQLDLVCAGVVTLPRGMITLHTRLALSPEAGLDQVVVITGGSGAYADAGGHLVIHELSHEGREAIYEFRVVHLASQR